MLDQEIGVSDDAKFNVQNSFVNFSFYVTATVQQIQQSYQANVKRFEALLTSYHRKL